MHIDLWTLGLQTINVLVLVWILGRFFFRPVTAMIAARQVAATEALDEAQAAKAEAAAEVAKAKEEAASLTAARTDILQKAVAEAEKEKAALLAAARTEAKTLRDAAHADIDRARQSEEMAEADHACRLAVDIAARLFEKLPAEARVMSFIDGLVAGVAALPDATRTGIGADGVPVCIKAARDLTEAEKEACRAKLAQTLGRPISVAVAVDPVLIAGLEIDTPHAVVRNSFRADLDRIAAGLTRHDH
ncbi:ATPase [Parvibaculum sedimenti]|uniref:ATP synthase subunit b n=1 Tax=Parvibaculum sedimenti TaxID=2608632 RepID=A0A6N6VCE6_9HYPH|nr:F0F1 ATP synthase subunit delta [Parvibaculum sedimenti]KAB7738395.1 ATPase [Parvibaculum sedimenti]